MSKAKRNPRSIIRIKSMNKNEVSKKKRFMVACAIAAMVAPQGLTLAGALMTTTRGTNIPSVELPEWGPVQLSALSAVIVVNNTSSTKTAGFGSYSFHAKDSVLGDGVTVEHSARWRILSAPDGFVYTCNDYRTGSVNGAFINLAGGTWYGWTYAFPMTLAGDYVIELVVTDANGVESTTTTTVTVAAFTGTLLYLNGNATGANDGTSSANAYTAVDTALGALVTAGSNTHLSVAGGQVYNVSVTADLRPFDNQGVLWDGTGTKPVFDMAGASTSWARHGGENTSVYGIVFGDSAKLEQTSAIYHLTTSAVDFCVYECELWSSGESLANFSGTSPGAGPRLLMYNNDSSVGVGRYSLVFGSWVQADLVGNDTGDCLGVTLNDERPIRLTNAAGLSTIAYNNFITSRKEHIALQGGTHVTIAMNKGIRTDEGRASPSNNVYVHYLDTQSFHTTIENNDFAVTSNQVSAMSCIKATTTAAKVSGMDIMLRGNVLAVEGPLSKGGAIDSQGDRVFLLNNTVSGASWEISAAIAAVSAITDCRVQGNVFKYTGPVHKSAFSDRLLSFGLPVKGDISDNDLDQGLSNAHQSKYWNVNGTISSTATVNGLAFASGNNEDTITLDSDHMPSPLNASTNPQGIIRDYYGNAMTVGGAGSRGAVQSVPTTPDIPDKGTDLTPADDATGVSNLVSPVMLFSENMATGSGTAELRLVSDDSVVDSVLASQVVINPSDRRQVSFNTISLPSSGAVYMYIPDGFLVAQASGIAFAGYTTNTDWNWAILAQEPELGVTTGGNTIADGGAIDLGDAVVFEEATTIDLVISNAGNADANIGTIVAGGHLSIDAAANPSGTIIAPAGQATIRLVVNTNAAGAIAGTLSIPSDDASTPFDLTVTGTVLDEVIPETNDAIRTVYLNIAEANAILNHQLMSVETHKQAWDSLDDADKDKCLAMATADFDAIAWIGHKADVDQANTWPKINRWDEVILPDGEAKVPASVVALTGSDAWSFANLPSEIRIGVALQAAAKAAEALSLDMDSSHLGRARRGITGVSGGGQGVIVNRMVADRPSSHLCPKARQFVGRYLRRSAGAI